VVYADLSDVRMLRPKGQMTDIGILALYIEQWRY